MCLYPKLILNKKYTSTLKNGGVIPLMPDERVKYVPIGCGRCIECLGKKKREWQVRLYEEIKKDKSGQFVTLTFTDESLNKLCEEFGITESNAIATYAVRRFFERWRKLNKKSVKHWLITELGHPPHSERIHLHGLLFTDKSEDYIKYVWKYGDIFIGNYVNNRTINYIIKYVTKIDTDHKNYIPIILTSPGIGKGYITERKKQKAHDFYKSPNGYEISLPIYYRNKLFTEEEREKKWIELLDKEERWIRGIKVDVSTDEGMEYFEMLQAEKQIENVKLGYGDDSDKWRKKNYNVTKNYISKLTKMQKFAENKELVYKELEEKVKKREKKFAQNKKNTLSL